MSADLVEYLLRLGDDALIAAQRLGEWTSRAPDMEEDVALANIALDQLGAARLFLTYAGDAEGAGRDEDALAYLREDFEFRNVQLVELPDSDFGTAIAKLLCLATYQHLLYGALCTSADERIAAIAGKCVKESAYHVDHAQLWTARLGAGTDTSHRRMVAALDEIWAYSYELFETDDLIARLGPVAVDPASLEPAWRERVGTALAAGDLAVPETTWRPSGGRCGKHTESLSRLLAEMQVVHRVDPGATW